MIHCRFCDATFALPRDLRPSTPPRNARSGRHDRLDARTLWTVAGVVGCLAVAVAAYVDWRLESSGKTRVKPDSAAVPTTPVERPTPAPRQPPPDDPDGSSVVRARLSELAKEGCSEVLLPPALSVGQRDIDAKFVAGGPCVRIVASSGTRGSALKLTMRGPDGAYVPVPAPSTTIELAYCPTRAGPHPASITGAPDDPYTVAAVNCSRP